MQCLPALPVCSKILSVVEGPPTSSTILPTSPVIAANAPSAAILNAKPSKTSSSTGTAPRPSPTISTTPPTPPKTPATNPPTASASPGSPFIVTLTPSDSTKSAAAISASLSSTFSNRPATSLQLPPPSWPPPAPTPPASTPTATGTIPPSRSSSPTS